MVEYNNPKEMPTVEAVKIIKKVFEKYRIRFWMDCGSLLGIVRDKRLLPWDTDVDLFALQEDINYMQLIRALDELERLGYEVCIFWEMETITMRKKDCLHMSLHMPTRDLKNPEKVYFTQRKPLTFFGNVLAILWWMLTAARYGVDREGRKKREMIIKAFTIIYRRKGGELQKRNVSKFWPKLTFTTITNIFRLFPFKNSLINLINKISKRNTKLIKWKYRRSDYNELKEIPFYDSTIYSPKDPEGHFEYCYGKDWRVPKYGDDWVETRDYGMVKEGMTDYHLPNLKSVRMQKAYLEQNKKRTAKNK